MKKALVLIISLAVLLTSFPSFAYEGKDAAIIGDTLVVRPLSLAAIAVGAAVFIVSLPFALPSGSVDKTAEELIVKPVDFAFTRPLGDFSRSMDYSELEDPN